MLIKVRGIKDICLVYQKLLVILQKVFKKENSLAFFFEWGSDLSSQQLFFTKCEWQQNLMAILDSK